MRESAEQMEQMILQAVRALFEENLSIPFKLSAGLVNFADEKALMSSITFSGSIKGLIAISITHQDACGIVSKMLREEVEEENEEEIFDGVGELVNIMGGLVKNKLAERGHDIKLGIPVTIRGNYLELTKSPEFNDRILMNFSGGDHRFISIMDYRI
jgi:chemotaxis protein CheX